jgi:hypothetical protein
METLIIRTEGEKLKAIKQLLKAMEVAFETKKEKSPYDPEFVKMVKESAKRGDYKVVDPANLWESLGLK